MIDTIYLWLIRLLAKGLKPDSARVHYRTQGLENNRVDKVTIPIRAALKNNSCHYSGKFTPWFTVEVSND